MRSAAARLARRSAGLASSAMPALLESMSPAAPPSAAVRAWPAAAGALTCSCRGLKSPSSLASASAAGPPTDGDASHDDFKPQFRAGEAPAAGGVGGGDSPSGVDDIIKADLAEHRVFVYMKVRGGEREGEATLPPRPDESTTRHAPRT